MVEIIPKIPEKYSLKTRVLFSAALFSLVLSLGGFLTLLFLESKTEEQLFQVEGLLGAEKTSEELQLENNVFIYKTKLQDFSLLIKNRKNALPLFSFLQNTVHPEVFYKRMNFDAPSNKLQLQGQATSFRVLDEQLLVFGQREELARFSLSDIKLSAQGGVDFQLELSFLNQFFQP